MSTEPFELIRVRGQVQGVGFRPLVARLSLAGWVQNDADGVSIALGRRARRAPSCRHAHPADGARQAARAERPGMLMLQTALGKLRAPSGRACSCCRRRSANCARRAAGMLIRQTAPGKLRAPSAARAERPGMLTLQTAPGKLRAPSAARAERPGMLTLQTALGERILDMLVGGCLVSADVGHPTLDAG